MQVNACQLRLNGRGVLFSFFLMVSIFLTPQSYAGEKEDSFMMGAVNTINERYEELFYEFSDLVLRKYCPTQYDEMTTYVKMVYEDNFRITLTELANQKESFMIELLQECSEKDAVLGLEYKFNEYVANMSADLTSRLKTLIENVEVMPSFEKREEMANQVLEVVLAQDFKADKVFAKLTLPEKENTSINIEFLKKSAKTMTFDAEALVELERMAHVETVKAKKKEEQKGRCPVCKKKLGYFGITCDCGGEFCMAHRYPEEHECTFDHKAKYRKRLEAENPVVRAKKLEDI